MDFVYFCQWYLGLTYVGLVTFIWLRPHFSQLTDQGYTLSKALGLLLITYIAWILSSTHLAPYHWITLTAIVAILTGLAIHTLRSPKKQPLPLKAILSFESLFLSLIVIWSLVRAINPRIEGVEKFMNIAFINAALRTDYFPMIDPWFAGEPPNYYYFGHLMIASLAKLTHVPANFAFNLAVATIFALSATLITALVYSLTRHKIAALTAALLAVLASNLDPALNMLRQTKDYIFFSATRLDPYVINEFPLYSFIVADLHAHTINLINVLSIITLLYVIHRQATNTQNQSSPATHHWSRLTPIIPTALLALTLGATAPTNAFDALIYGALTGMVMLHIAYKRAGRQASFIAPALTALAHTTLIGLAAILLYLPFWLHFHSPTGGIGIALFQTPLSHLLINFGTLLFLSLPLLYIWKKKTTALQDHKEQTQGTEALKLFDLRVKNFEVSPEAAPSLTDTQNSQNPHTFPALILTTALLFILFLQLFYIKDIYAFENPPYNRANTFFKIGYQIWILLSITAGYGLYLASKVMNKYKLTDLYIAIAGLLIALSLAGTYSAFQYHFQNPPQTLTLDGYHYLQSENPDQLHLITWLNQNISGQPVTVEAAGESYTQRSRVSSYTGLPTIIGWASHEWGWRYSQTAWAEVISPRVQDVQTLYTTTDPTELQRLIDQYQVHYIVASPVEKDLYQLDNFSTIQSLAGPPLYQVGDYAVYSIR